MQGLRHLLRRSAACARVGHREGRGDAVWRKEKILASLRVRGQMVIKIQGKLPIAMHDRIEITRHGRRRTQERNGNSEGQ